MFTQYTFVSKWILQWSYQFVTWYLGAKFWFHEKGDIVDSPSRGLSIWPLLWKLSQANCGAQCQLYAASAGRPFLLWTTTTSGSAMETDRMTSSIYQVGTQWGYIMDQITIKTPNRKCRLYWRLIEFIYWRYSQSYWYFRPLCELAPIQPSHWFTCPPVWISTGIIVFIQCVTGGGGGWGPQTEKHLPPNTFNGQF